MASNTSGQTQGSSSSERVVKSLPSDGVLDLGRSLVDELGLGNSVDTLGRWMAHYVAGLIEAAKSGNESEKEAKAAAASQAILELWRHRHELPSGKRPFEDLEPIFFALTRLDPFDSTPTYFRGPRWRAYDEDEKDDKALPWLELADEADYCARLMICHFLRRAAEHAKDKSKKWVRLAEEAHAAEGIDIEFIRFVVREEKLSEAARLEEGARRDIAKRIERLESFKQSLQEVILSLQQELTSK